jgi:hypothetical protein
MTVEQVEMARAFVNREFGHLTGPPILFKGYYDIGGVLHHGN